MWICFVTSQDEVVEFLFKIFILWSLHVSICNVTNDYGLFGDDFYYIIIAKTYLYIILTDFAELSAWYFFFVFENVSYFFLILCNM